MDIEKRIKDLNDKASQLLLFLSFALVAAILLETNQVQGHALTSCQSIAVKWSLRFLGIQSFADITNRPTD